MSRAMYVPPHFAVTRTGTALDFIRMHPFGTLVSLAGGALFATHVPFCILRSEPEIVLGLHVARANRQWNEIDGQNVLAIFRSAHAHVSAEWYEHPAQMVPTWNYAAVHCSGRARLVSDTETRRILEQIVRENEGERGWNMSVPDEAYLEGMQRAIKGIELGVERVDAQFKYSQNRTPADRERVIAALSAQANPQAQQLAREMQAFYDGAAGAGPEEVRT